MMGTPVFPFPSSPLGLSLGFGATELLHLEAQFEKVLN